MLMNSRAPIAFDCPIVLKRCVHASMIVCGPAESDHFSMIICVVSAIRSVGQYTDCYPRIDRRSSLDMMLHL
jgi:hypothetical protein